MGAGSYVRYSSHSSYVSTAHVTATFTYLRVVVQRCRVIGLARVAARVAASGTELLNVSFYTHSSCSLARIDSGPTGVAFMQGRLLERSLVVLASEEAAM
ncbi:uncharacterized protein BDR25DRAFT_353142 [Lindgomyces ingoldianus]|uniref:Uncharacterized protein n=1 Tax=Lindgomyces ingoldianus TaxID=673940 RepID=A0ACB6R168_9PLEO|nr:uncharacterized protein BDR25DRAFT_353142 [Lindgomyces ingoldianus]KAF2472830.1 hypothetical protein BDR25DRAFT_353142 [Lindgomyces ingoldianus]